MIKELRLVRGAVAKKDIVPVLTHFHIYDGRIQGGNGKISIDAPCESLKGLDVTVPAERFLKAVDACGGEPKLKVTPAGKLSVKNKKFSAMLPLAEHDKFPLTGAGDCSVSDFKDLLSALRLLQPFIADDATRLWSNGVWLHDGYAYATNNVVLARTKVNINVSCIIPAYAIEEILRIGLTPIGYQLTEKALYLFYEHTMWLRSHLIEGQWPESVADMIKPVKDMTEVGEEFFLAVQRIVPFCPETSFPRICLNDGKVATDDGAMSAEIDGFTGMAGFYHATPLLAVAAVANGIDFSSYPSPSYFKGINIEGILVGIKA